MWGTLDDPTAGVLESQYFESLNLPSYGIRSWERSMSKNDFYQIARRRGAPPVPGTDRFPLFVKQAKGCVDELIDDQSVCHNQEELERALRRINVALYDGRVRRAEAMGIEDAKAFAESYNPVGRDSDDIVVQEYIDGQDYGCTVIEMGDACIALAPYKFDTKEGQRILTFDTKFDHETRFELLQKKDNPVLFERLQKAAIEAFLISGCQGSNTGCDVDLRARPDGDVVVIEVTPQPAGLPIIHSLPGGHSVLTNIYIANYLLRNAAQQGVSEQIAEEYDSFASQYDTMIAKTSTIAAGIKALTDSYDFDGTVFDLACGTGVFGRMLVESKPARASRLLGFDISSRMGDICRSTGLYEHVHIESMEEALLNCHRFAERVDHIVCFSALHLLRPEIFAFVLVLCFTLAKKSISISIDEITDVYNENMEKTGLGFMYSRNHLAGMLAFREPPNWRLTKRTRQYSWSSAATGDEIYTTYFRFDRIGESQDLMFKGPEVPN
jgi:SAM-dependent methyltransferase